MESIHYIDLVVHKKTIAYCVKTAGGKCVSQGEITAERKSLVQWAEQMTVPWFGALEATMFTGWIYDVLKPYARELKVAHPERWSKPFVPPRRRMTVPTRRNWPTCCGSTCCPNVS